MESPQHETIIAVPASQEHTAWLGGFDNNAGRYVDIDDVDAVDPQAPVIGYGETSHEPYVMYDGRIVLASQVNPKCDVTWRWASERIVAAIRDIPPG